MYLDISSKDFRCIFEQETFYLPQRWDGKDFHSTVESLFAKYCKALRDVVGDSHYDTSFSAVAVLCHKTKLAIEEYFRGHPSRAFHVFSEAMDILMDHPIGVYQKTGETDFFEADGDPLKLFRVRNVQQIIPYSRSDIFHTPYNLRSKVATCRYSIAGYPSLYLGTSLALCGEESKANSINEFQIASRFELIRNRQHYSTTIKVIEMAIKPQDFFQERNRDIEYDQRGGRRFNTFDLDRSEMRSAYLLWYPLIAACSYIRTSKLNPFAAEYIIPQLLMQWIRHKYEQDALYGIRYFSCASFKASDMGFNYVFPVSGRSCKRSPQFCEVLAKSFRLTIPHYIHEFLSWDACEKALVLNKESDLIF